MKTTIKIAADELYGVVVFNPHDDLSSFKSSNYYRKMRLDVIKKGEGGGSVRTTPM